METKFQTSFIPKKPLIATESVRVHAHVSIFMIIGTLAFIVSIVIAGGTFLAKSYLLKSQEKLKLDLTENVKRFNLPLIEELKTANTKIDLANELLRSHAAVSEAFHIIAALTAEKVHFANFEFTSVSSSPDGAPQTTGTYNIKMKGVTDSFNSVAFQSDVFSRSMKYGTNKVLKNPILSDLTVDPSGNINFQFTAGLGLDDISYEKLVASTSTAQSNQ